jgi:hypothetical protein
MSFSKVVKGEGTDAYLLGDPSGNGISGAFTTTAPIQSAIDNTTDYDGLSLHLIVDFEQDQVAVISGTDAVVAATGVWTFGNFTFTGLVGAKLVVSGATNAGNNGTFAITAVSGHTATTATTGLVNETFGPNVAVFVIRSEAASVPAGAWTVLGANDFSPGSTATPAAGLNNQALVTQYGQPPQAGHFASITAMFTVPAVIAAVATASSQIVEPAEHFSIRHYYVVFTPSSGRGTARVARFGKSWSR